MAAWQAILQVFPGNQLMGCVFHWTQAVWRKVQQVGLQETYRQRQTVHSYLRMLLALPLIPGNSIETTFRELEGKANSDPLKEVVRYVRTSWLENSLFPVESWCVFDQSVFTPVLTVLQLYDYQELDGNLDTMSECEPIVIDNGSWMCKAGFAGDKTARAYERTVVTESINENTANIMERGAVKDWDEMERFFEFVFEKELRISIQGKLVLLTEVPFNSQQHRRHLVELFMEKLCVEGLYITDPASLALFSSGRSSGVVIDMGGEVTQISTLINGTQIQTDNPSRRIDIGGNDMTRYLVNELNKQDLKSEIMFTEAEEYKHKLCGGDGPDTYTTPSGVKVQVEASHRNSMDVLFDPSLIGRHLPGAADILHDVLMSCDQEQRQVLSENIIISGGASMYRDIDVKMASQLRAKGFKDCNIKICAPPERRKSSWLGGSIIASFDEFPSNMCKSRQRYMEHGWVDFLSFNESELLKQT